MNVFELHAKLLSNLELLNLSEELALLSELERKALADENISEQEKRSELVRIATAKASVAKAYADIVYRRENTISIAELYNFLEQLSNILTSEIKDQKVLKRIAARVSQISSRKHSLPAVSSVQSSDTSEKYLHR